MKALIVALAFTALAGAARADEPENVCEFSYKHQVTIHNGPVPSYYCYAVQTRESCPAGTKCGSSPAMMPQQCSFPAEVRKRRCIPVNASADYPED